MDSKSAARIWLILGILTTNFRLNPPMSGTKDLIIVAALGWACSFCLGKFVEVVWERKDD